MPITYGELKKRILLKIDEFEADAEGMTDDEDIKLTQYAVITLK